MNGNIKLEIENYKSSMLNHYKNLIVAYENSDRTQLILKAKVFSGSDSTSPVILEYTPSINATAMFELKGTAFNTTLHFISVVG